MLRMRFKTHEGNEQEC